MSVIPLPAFQDNYIWTIVNDATHSVFCVDPGDAKPVIDYCRHNRLQLNQILLTHHHFDHTGGVDELLEKYPSVKIYGPKDSRIPLINQPVRDEDIIHINNYDFRVMSIPGHTSTHICFHEPTRKWLFCGDTLFSAGCGRVFDGTMLSLYHSLQVLKNLPDDTLIFCAHEYTINNLQFAHHVEPGNKAISEYKHSLLNQRSSCTLPSNIALEKQINPFFRVDKPDIVNFVRNQGGNTSTDLSIFSYLRTKKDIF